jgi:hypothetical protein
MQKNGPARVEAPSGAVHRKPLLRTSTAGLRDHEATSQYELLPLMQGPEDRAAHAHAGTGTSPRTIRFEPRRISQRLQPERGWSIWEHKSGIQRKYESERSGWC